MAVAQLAKLDLNASHTLSIIPTNTIHCSIEHLNVFAIYFNLKLFLVTRCAFMLSITDLTL